MRVPNFSFMIDMAELNSEYCHNCGKHYDDHWEVTGRRRICPVSPADPVYYKRVMFFNDQEENQP